MSIVCIRCGVKAYSKCPNCRNAFLNASMSVKALAMCAEVKMDDMFPKVVLTLTYSKDEDMAAKFREDCESIGVHTSIDDIRQAFCNHRWAWQPGCKSSIDCGCTLNPLPDDIREKFCQTVDNPAV